MSVQRNIWRITGMQCVHCEETVKKALSGLNGLEDIQASFRSGTLEAEWDPELLTTEEIRKHLQAEGYDLAAPQNSTLFLRLFAAAGCFLLLYFLIDRSSRTVLFAAFPTVKTGMSLGAVFLVGVMTSAHCIGMCGGINLLQAGTAAKNEESIIRSSILYNLGRVLSYTAIGCLVGAIGSVFSMSSTGKAALQLLAAFFMLFMAVNLSGLFPGIHQFLPKLPMPKTKLRLKLQASSSSLLIGLANGLMPCGPLQSMQLFALSAGSWWLGGLSMLCFSLGTVPLMLMFGLVGGKLNQKFLKPMRIISAVLVLLMGISMLQNGLALVGIRTGSHAADNTEKLTAVLSDDERVQILTTELEYNSYPTFRVQAGIPVEWTVHADGNKLVGCNNEILIPAFDLDIPLIAGDNVITFLPEEEGTISYSCWMGMIRAEIIVYDGGQTSSK